MWRLWPSLLEPALEAAGSTRIVEIGSYQGQNTRNLLTYCERNGGIVHAVDPVPRFPVGEWQERYGPAFRFYAMRSLEALPLIVDYDAVLIDGDHNWYCVYHELLLIAERAAQTGRFPLVLLHDIDWPFARRDMYYDPEAIPAAYRHPYARGGVMKDGSLHEGGFLANEYYALKEGTPRNGVLTAVEDFLSQARMPLKFTAVPGIFGLGIIAPRTLPDERPALAEYLARLALSDPLAAHVRRLQEEWFDLWYRSAEEERRFAEEYRRFHRDRTEALDTIARLRATKSWRFTAPLRRAEEWLRRLSRP